MNNKLKSNIIYQILYQLVVMVIPFFLNPYLVRTLGVDGVGLYAIIYTFVNYFLLVCNLGVEHYGNRLIAVTKTDTDKLNKAFSEVFTIRVIITIAVILAYYITVILFYASNPYYLIMGGFLIAALLDVTWLCYGLEKFKVNVLRNLFVKIIMIVLAVMLVKDTEDLFTYMCIMVSLQFVGNILVFIGCKSEVKYVRVNIKSCLGHLKGMLVLFLPIVSITLYRSVDKTMLGVMRGNVEVGYYDCAEKIIMILCNLITCINAVMLPRISSLLAEENAEKANTYINRCTYLVSFFGCAVACGVYSVSVSFVSLYYGAGYEYVAVVLQMLCPTVVLLGINNLLRTQILIPNNQDKEYTVALVAGLVADLIANYFLIGKYGAIGASIGTIIAETTVFIFECYFCCKTKKNLFSVLIRCVPFIFFGIVMVLMLSKLNSSLNIDLLWIMVIDVFVGGGVYILMSFVYYNVLLKRKAIL